MTDSRPNGTPATALDREPVRAAITTANVPLHLRCRCGKTLLPGNVHLHFDQGPQERNDDCS